MLKKICTKTYAQKSQTEMATKQLYGFNFWRNVSFKFTLTKPLGQMS